MPTPVIMPKFDMDQETATVVEWLKEEGEAVRMDEDVLVVETDKVSIAVPPRPAAPCPGPVEHDGWESGHRGEQPGRFGR